MLTIYILVVTCVVSFLAFRSETVMDKLIFNPYRVRHNDEWQRLLSSGFIHANGIHLLVNMLVLFSFGGVVEEYYSLFFGERGTIYFLILYLGSIPVSILPTYYKQKDNASYNALGASGAVSAVLFSFILFKPLDKICLYGILCFPGILLGAAYLIYSYFASKKATDHINHDAHFWGALYGIALTLFFQPKLGVYFIDQLRGATLDRFLP